MQYTTEFKVKKTQAFKMDKTALLQKWGARLREYRILFGYRNQGDLADAMIKAGYDITQPAISRAENGQLEKPQEDIADFFIEHHRDGSGKKLTKDDIFKIPTDWQQKYYQLLEEIKDRPTQARVDQLEGMVQELKEEVRKLRDNKGKEN